VIVMVAYHTLNYFVEGYPLVIYGYVYYVAQSFVFYSGFICGTIYFAKIHNDRRYVYSRLIIRSFKLIALFFIVNIIINLLFTRNYNGQEFGIDLIFNNLYSIFFIGGGAFMAFDILLPIAYVLLISVLLLKLHTFKYIFYTLLILLYCILSFSDIKLTYNVSYTLMGIGGVYSGIIYKDNASILNKRLIRYACTSLLVLYLVILIPSGINVRGNYILLFLYVNLIIANLYMLGTYLNPSNMITKNIITFGQYSLYLYLAQIFILQILYRIVDFKSSSVTVEHCFVFILINLLLILCCYATDIMRNKISLIDKAYRLIFS